MGKNTQYEIHIQSTTKMIEVAQQYGREEILEKNLERLQDIYKMMPLLNH